MNWSSGALTADGMMLITAAQNQSFANLFFLPGHSQILGFERNGEIDSVATSPDGRQLLIASGRGHVQLARLPIGVLRRFSHEPRDGKYSSVYAAHFDPSEEHVITASYDGTLRSWSIEDGSQRVLQTGAPVIDARYSPDGKRLASLDSDGTLRLFDAQTLAVASQIKLTPAWPLAEPLLFSSDSQLLTTLQDFAAPASESLQLWHPLDGHSAGTIGLDCKPVGAMFLPSSDRLVAGCEDGRGEIWSASQPGQLITLAGASSRLLNFASLGNGLVAGFAEHDSNIHLWSASDGSAHEPITLPAPEFPASLAFAHAGRLLAIGTSSGHVLLYDMSDRSLRTIGAHTKEVPAVQFVGDDLLVSYRADSTVKIWDARRGELLRDVGAHDWLAWSASMDHSASRLLTGGLDGAATLWNIGAEQRSEVEIASRLQCYAPWRLAGDALAPAAASGCR